MAVRKIAMGYSFLKKKTCNNARTIIGCSTTYYYKVTQLIIMFKSGKSFLALLKKNQN